MKDGRNASCKMDQPIYLFLLFVLCTILKRLFNDGSLPDEVNGEGTKNSVVKNRCQLAFEKEGTSETSVDKVIRRGKIEENSLRVLVEFFRRLNQHMAKESVENIGIEKKLSTYNTKTRKQEDIVKINLNIQSLIDNYILSDQLTKQGMKMILNEIEHYLLTETITYQENTTLSIEWVAELKENIEVMYDLLITGDVTIQTNSQTNINSNTNKHWTQIPNLPCSHLSSVKMITFR